MATFVRGAVGAALLTAGLITAPQAGAQQQKITVAWYGGNWGDAFRACVAEPYTQATGVQVSPEVGTSTTTLAKLQQQKAAPTIDVAWLDGGISELAEQAGVLDTLDPAAIPNLKNVIDQGVYRRTGPPMRSAPAITRWASSTTRARSSSRRPAGRTCGGPNTPARWPCPRPPIPRACLSCSSWRASGRWIRPTWPRSTPSSPRWTRRCTSTVRVRPPMPTRAAKR